MKLKSKFSGETRVITLTEDLSGEAGQVLMIGDNDALFIVSAEMLQKFFSLEGDTPFNTTTKSKAKYSSRFVHSSLFKILTVFDLDTAGNRQTDLSAEKIAEILQMPLGTIGAACFKLREQKLLQGRKVGKTYLNSITPKGISAIKIMLKRISQSHVDA